MQRLLNVKRLEGLVKRLEGLVKRLEGLVKRPEGLVKRPEGLVKRPEGLVKRLSRIDYIIYSLWGINKNYYALYNSRAFLYTFPNGRSSSLTI